MKKINKIYLSLVSLFMALTGLVTTASAAVAGESVTVLGMSGTIFGYLLIVVAIVLAYMVWKAKKGAKNLQIVLGIAAIGSLLIGGYLSMYDVAVEVSEGQLATTTIVWDIGTPTADQGNVSISGNTITVRCGVNTTENVLTYPDASTLDDALPIDNPIINWTIQPRDTAPYTTETIVANSICTTTAADKVSLAGTDYNFFRLTSGTPTYKMLNWTFDAPSTTDFESIPVAVTVGEVGWVSLEVNYNHGLNNMAVWDSQQFTAIICGETYNIVLTNVNDVTA